MARTHGRILSAIWIDQEFIALPEGPQRLYLFLISQSDLNHAGLLPLRVKRWAAKTAGLDADQLWLRLEALRAARFVVIDEDTEELLVRTLVRNDGVYKQPKVMLRMREDARQIESLALRAAFVAELDRLPLDELSDKETGPHGDQPSTRQFVTDVVDTLRQEFGEAPEGVPHTLSDTPSDGYGVPTYVRAGARRPPPPPPPPPPPAPPTAGDAVAIAAPGAQGLIAEWIDHLPSGRPPGRLVGQVAKELGAMLTEGIPYNDVRAGLAAWQAKGLHPSALASVVHETRTPRATPSTTDQRVGAGAALIEKYAREEGIA